jgi:SAM-dependent methyltransferase
MTDFEVFAERERSGWSDKRIVDAYVAKFGPITDEVARELVARASAKSKDILDLCCGQGTLTAMLAAAGANVWGLDFSPEMLALAEARVPGANLRRGDAAALPFDDDSFDAVICNFGMMHLPDQPKALAEIRRVLRPGGQFLMATWAAPEASPAFGTVFSAIKTLADLSTAPPQPDLFAFARRDEADAMMTAAGLDMVAHDTVTPAWELSEPRELFEIFLTATVGAAMLIKSQQPEVLEAIRDRITSTVADKFVDGSGYRVPVPVAVVTAEPA